MNKIWWKLLGFKLLSTNKLKRLDNLEILHNLYDQGYNVFKFYTKDKIMEYNNGEAEQEIWGKKSIFKPKIILSKKEKYQKYFDTLPLHEILYHVNFAGIVENDFKIYAYKNRADLKNISYDNISIILDKFKNRVYKTEVIIYSPYAKEFRSWNDVSNIFKNDLILIGSEGFLERCKYKQTQP